MKSYYVYILKCSDRSFYIGVTNNVDARVSAHNLGLNKNAYTYNRRPVEIVHSEVYSDVRVAIEREKQLKGWTREKKLALINGKFEELTKLAKCRASTLNKFQGSA